jgi:hypothetical protein
MYPRVRSECASQTIHLDFASGSLFPQLPHVFSILVAGEFAQLFILGK